MAIQTAPDVGLDLRQAISGTAPAGPAEGLDLLPAVTYGPPPPEPPGAFKRGIKAGTAGVKSAAYGFGALAAHGAAQVLPESAAKVATGLETAALENVAAQNEIAAQDAITYEDVVADPTRLGEYLKYAAGSAVPSLATMAIGGGVGAGLGALAARKTAATLAARALGAIAPAIKTGSLVGAVIPDFAIEAGSIYPEALKTGVEDPALRSVTGGAGAAAIDFLTLPTAVRALMPAAGAVTRKAGMKAALGAAVRGAATAGAKVGRTEGVQELTQTFIERLAAGQDLTGPEAVSDYINSALVGVVAGGAIGGPVGAVRGATRPVAPNITPSGTIVPETVPPTPEALHADLTARHAAATEQLAALEPVVAQAQQEHDALVARREELNAESKREIGWRYTKSEITKEKRVLTEQIKTAKAKIEETGGQLFAARQAVTELAPQVEAARAAMEQQAAPVAVEPAPVAVEPAPVAVEPAPVPTPTEAEQIARAVTGARAAAGEVVAPKLGTLQERYPTAEAYKAAVKSGEITPDGTPIAKPQAAPAADIEHLRDNIAGILAMKKNLSTETKAVHAETIDQAIASITEEAKTMAEKDRPVLVKERVNKAVGFRLPADVKAEIADHILKQLPNETENNGVTRYSKGSVTSLIGEIDRRIAQADMTNQVERRAAERELLPAGVSPVAQGVITQFRAGKLTRAGAAQHLLQIASASTTRPEDVALITNAARAIVKPSYGALTQDEFETLPEPTQTAALSAYDIVMRERGTALRNRLEQLIGDRPEIRVLTYTTQPGGPIGSYLRITPLKSVISMALNAKDQLGVADHEGYHYAEDWLLTGGERKIIANAMKPGKPLFGLLKAKLLQYDRENQTNLTDEVTGTPAEARAYGFEFWRRGELKAEGALARVWQKLQQFFERVANAVKGLGFQSIEDVFAALGRGQMAQREAVFRGEEGEMMSSVAGGQSWYRSVLTESIAALQSKQASAQGWKDQIKGLVSNNKAKQAEIGAVGLNDWLDLQQGKVTKDQVLAFLGENGVQVRDVTLGDRDMGDVEAWWNDEGGANEETPFSELSRTEQQAASERYQDEVGNYQETGAPKFASYQLPGGKNYRELLLTLPGKIDPEAEARRIVGEAAWARMHQTTRDELIASATNPAAQRTFHSSHYDQPNILAHIRFNERTDAQGKRVLFLEEIQSDWAQKGRKEGFGLTGEERKELRTLRGIPSNKATAEQKARFSELSAKEPGGINYVPSAPFVGKTEAWTALALKRMIRYASENGFDRIAWTTGEQQAARYDLSKSVDSIGYQKRGENYNVTVWGKNGERVWQNQSATAKDVEDTIGKEMLDKMNQEHGRQEGSLRYLEGLDLKVGGEGMKGYYDKIVPSVANDILRKLGGGKVGEVRGLIANGVEGQRYEGGTYSVPALQLVLENRDLPAQLEGQIRDVIGALKSGQKFSAAIEYHGSAALAEELGGKMVQDEKKGVQPGFDITPKLAEHAANGLPLFSKAAIEMDALKANGQLEAIQVGEQWARHIENADIPREMMARAAGIAKEDVIGGTGRWWTNNMSTPNFISAASKGFENVYKVFNTYSRYRKILAEQLVREKLPSWYKASDADRKAAFDAMLKRTVNGYSRQSSELAELLRPLTREQRTLFDQATTMIAGVLQRQFDSQKETRKLQLTTPGAYEKWLANRQEQVDSLLDKGYVPLRRYGDHSVTVYMEAPDGKRVKASLEFFNSPSAAKAAAETYAREIETSGLALKVEQGQRSKNERETGVSLEQFLGTLRRQEIDISQAERERLVVVMTNADSLVRTQMMHREGLAGFSTDGMRVLHEFGTNTAAEVAYARFAPVIDAALDGAEVIADVSAATGEVSITIGESFGKREDGVANNLWERDGPKSGFYKDRANAMADAALVPDRQSEWATKLRVTGVMYFIGGSISGAAVNTMSVPMILTPYLSQHTNYIDATMASMRAWKDSWQHYNLLRDMDQMRNPSPETAAKLDAAGITKEMRAAIVAAADTIFDTEIHMMLGISQGSLYSKSRKLQRAAEIWMSPFRVAEQTNRLTSFIAAYRIATTGEGVKGRGRLSGQELFRFAHDTVESTQNNYDVHNRPGIMNNPIGALMFQFKSFPLFVIEAARLMYKQNPKSAVYMLLGLTAMAGIQGLPFAEEILNLVDVISQQLFGSPFNSRRALRNVFKTASDAIGAADMSDVLMRGLVNEITGANFATRVSSGFLPGTRIGATDVDQGRALSDIAGAPYSMVRDTMSNVGGFVSGVATGDWTQAADAVRAGGPIALRNIVKGTEQLSSGYASDSRGRKVAEVSTMDGILQLTGLSSAAVTKAQDLNSIVIQTKAYHDKVSQDMQQQLVQAYRDGDAEKQKEIFELVGKWNEQNPGMPIMPNRSAVRRAIMLANVPLDRRAQMMLNRNMRDEFADLYGEGAE